MLPNAEEMVAHQIPAITAGGQNAISSNTLGLLIKSSDETVNAK